MTDYKNEAHKLTRRAPEGCHVILRTALVCPLSTIIFVVSSNSMSLIEVSLNRQVRATFKHICVRDGITLTRLPPVFLWDQQQ